MPAPNCRVLCLALLNLSLAAVVCLSATTPRAEADEFRTRVVSSVPVRTTRIPYTADVTLRDVSATRLGVRVVLDLRQFQANAAGILSRVLDETCHHKYAAAVADAGAQGASVTLRGQFQAKFFTCNDSDPKVHYRGSLMFGQNVDVAAAASARVRGNCLHLQLDGLQLDLVGLVGGLAEIVGLQDKAQELIIEKGNAILAGHPVCPKLPPEFAALDPEFYGGGTTEIGSGGVGAYLDGSVDVSAATLLSLVQVMIDKDLLEGVQ